MTGNQQLPASLRVQNVQSVARRGDDALSVGRVGGGIQLAVVSAQHREQSSGLCIPNASGTIKRSGDDTVAIG